MAVIFKKLTATLPAGSNTHTFTDNLINANSVIEVYCDNDDVYPTDIYMSNTNAVTVEYSDHAEEVHIALTINNAESFEPYDDTDILDKYYEVKTDVLNVEARTEMVEGAVNDLGIRVANNSSRIQYAVVLSETASREVNDAIEGGYIDLNLNVTGISNKNISSDGLSYNVSNNYFSLGNPISIEGGNTITISSDVSGPSEIQTYVGLWDKNENWIERRHIQNLVNGEVTYTLDDNVGKIYLFFYNALTNINGSYIKIEYGSYATPYVPSNKELQTSKQDKLTAGSGITITNNVISATGGGGGGNTNIYSESEVVIGTFLDKPLYRKMSQTTIGASTSDFNVTSYVPADVKYILSCRHFKILGAATASIDLPVWKSGSDWKARAFEGTSAGGTMYFIFEYTKVGD